MKPRLLFRGPVLTASGYGVHSRQLVKAILATNAFDLTIEAISWGQTPFILRDEDQKFYDLLMNLSLRRQTDMQQGVKYDVSIQCTIPNEFQKLAAVNIGVTAGIEVDVVSPQWLLKTNEMVDLLVVPSQHSRDAFVNARYDGSDGSVLTLKKPVVVVPEGFDERYFHTRKDDAEALDFVDFDTDWNFLFVGLGLDRPLGEDRKNIGNLVKWFCERFSGDKDVGLILKVGILGGSLIDFEMTKRRIAEIKAATKCGEYPRIHVIHGRMSDREMGLLYRHPKVKAMVSLTHGEGFGLPLLEAAACGLPVVATNWSGHVDFLKIDGKNRFVAVDYDLKPIPESAVWQGVMEAGTSWAVPREQDARDKMRKLYLSYSKPKEWADELAKSLQGTNSLTRVAHLFAKTVIDFLNGDVQQSGPGPVTLESLKKKFARKPPQTPLTNGKTLLYTMPMSAGDVFVSTAVIDSLRKKFPEHHFFFATQPKYRDILKKNGHIDEIIDFEQWMLDVPLLEKIFDEVYTPNLAVQMVHSNWVHGGKGRKLAEELASQCMVPLGDYYILPEEVGGLPPKYVVLHPGSGKGQWEARNYRKWQEVVDNVSRHIPVVQVGEADDPLYKGTIDFRGKTTYNQLAWVLSNAECLVGIDSVSMHIAASLAVPAVALFGSSYPTSTGPSVKTARLPVLLETPSRYTCEKACYKYQCSVDRDHPCINEISPRLVVKNVLDEAGIKDDGKYVENRPKVSGYTHVLNAKSQGFPYIESIRSMLGFCDEVVVVDGGSTDGTVEAIKVLAAVDPRINLVTREWDWDEPGMDGMQKAFARAMCTGDFLWQQDADEVVHEEDYTKVRKLVDRFPSNVDLLHLPVVELWGSLDRVRTDRHSWKWRLSRNDFKITHGINKHARLFDEKTGKTYAKKGMSDGCEYVDIMTNDFIPHAGFYNQRLENLRTSDPVAYGEEMNRIFEELPCVFHYSWANLERKVRNFKEFWNKCWSKLYNDPAPVDRFPDVKTDDDIKAKALELSIQGGEHQGAYTFTLRRSNPAMMKEWLSK